MSYAILPLVSLLLTCFLAGAALPFAMLAERRRAVTRRRSLYEKSADQMGALTCLAQALPALAVAADLPAGGLVSRLAAGPWHLIWWLAAAGSALAALFSLLDCVLRRNGRRNGRGEGCGSGSSALVWLSGLSATAAAVCVAGVVWAFLRGVGLDESGPQEFVILSVARTVWIGAAQAGECALAALFGLTCLALAPASALGLGLAWQALRRGVDDFGRDYYAVTMGGRARRASYSGACLLLFSALLMWLTPAFSPARLPGLLPGAEGMAGVAVWLFGIACLGLPAAVLCWYLTARSGVPLRRKTLIFAAPPLLWLGMYGILARLWL